jgi:Tol biopolymer transport system component
VAYAWSTKPGLDQRYQLRVVPNQAGAPPRILVDSPECVYFVPAAWSRDGQSILAHVWKPDRSMQLAWISAANGAIRVLKSLGRRTFDRVSLSPDGRNLVYSARQRPDTVNSSIYLMAADGSGEMELAGGNSINEAPAWTPDGARVFFTSNRSGRFALWSIDVRNGGASGAPVLVKPELGRILAMGFTSPGTFYYMHVTPTRDLFVAQLNPADSTLRGSPVALTDAYTGSRLPAWSPDGKAVAFARETNLSAQEDNDLVIRFLDSGQERIYAGADVTGQPIWLPDGRSLLIPTWRQNRASLQRVNLETGVFTSVLEKDVRQAALASDARTLYAAVGRTIQAVDLATGRERQVFIAPGPNNVQALALSPDGRTLAFPLERRTVGLVGVDGAGFREFPAAGIRQVAWSRDGRAILFEAFAETTTGAGGPIDRKLMRLPVDGGMPEFTGVDLEGVFSLTSDGTRLVFTRSRSTGGFQRRVEVWALDNLLAKPAR